MPSVTPRPMKQQPTANTWLQMRQNSFLSSSSSSTSSNYATAFSLPFLDLGLAFGLAFFFFVMALNGHHFTHP